MSSPIEIIIKIIIILMRKRPLADAISQAAHKTGLSEAELWELWNKHGP